MGSDKDYLFEIDDGVGLVTLNRPERMNAVTWELASDLVELFRDLRLRDEVRTIVLTGAGRAFCSGGDAEWLSGSGDRPIPGLSEEQVLPRYQRKTPAGPFAEFTRMIVEVEKPVIAAIRGPAVGAGLAYALACDRRFADSTARMSAAMVRLGFAPDCGVTWLLPRVTRLSTALRMVETGDIIDAKEAH
ncbi:MAG: enoyl-CoA hydratase/isomerase family protein, partial [Candidatus Binatia bacterium]